MGPDLLFFLFPDILGPTVEDRYDSRKGLAPDPGPHLEEKPAAHTDRITDKEHAGREDTRPGCRHPGNAVSGWVQALLWS